MRRRDVGRDRCSWRERKPVRGGRAGDTRADGRTGLSRSRETTWSLPRRQVSLASAADQRTPCAGPRGSTKYKLIGSVAPRATPRSFHSSSGRGGREDDDARLHAAAGWPARTPLARRRRGPERPHAPALRPLRAGARLPPPGLPPRRALPGRRRPAVLPRGPGALRRGHAGRSARDPPLLAPPARARGRCGPEAVIVLDGKSTAFLRRARPQLALPVVQCAFCHDDEDA